MCSKDDADRSIFFDEYILHSKLGIPVVVKSRPGISNFKRVSAYSVRCAQ